MHIIVSDHLPESGWSILNSTDNVTTSGPFQRRSDLLDAANTADAIIIRSATLADRELFDAAPKLKVVARAGARLDNIDLDEATRRGIMVINVPDANVFAVVEHAFGLLLAFAREIPAGFNAVRKGEWPRNEMLGIQLQGKTMGIVGFGRLGRETAERAQSFGMHVLVYDPYIDLSFARERDVEILSFEELLQRSDFIVPMTAYTQQTHHLIDAAALRQVKSGSLLINVVHAGLINEEDLLEALDSRLIGGAALDTFQIEPPHPENRLFLHPRVLATPHLNQNTHKSQSITGQQVVLDVLAALSGRDFRNVVNLPFHPAATYDEVRPYIHLAAKLGKLQGQLAEGWITRVEVELLGAGLRNLVRPVAAVLLSGMLLPVEGRPVNWVSAPVLAYEQGVSTAQAKNLLDQEAYPNLMICRIHWENKDEGSEGQRTVAGVLFANGDARLVQYDEFHIDADPEGFVVILENNDSPGILGRVGTQLGNAGINITNWRYGRVSLGGRAVSFINVDSAVPAEILDALANHPEIHRARVVRL